jgi:hypothetical protein
VGGGYQSYVIIVTVEPPPYAYAVTASSRTRNLYEINMTCLRWGTTLEWTDIHIIYIESVCAPSTLKGSHKDVVPHIVMAIRLTLTKLEVWVLAGYK